ncbi:MAG: ABC transporter permease [Chloroflexota bacterium]
MEQLIATTLRTATPIALVALGGVIAWRAGIFHLGLEGLMVIGAFFAVAGTVATGEVILGVLCAIVACCVTSAIFWVVIVPLRANAIIAGLGLSIIGVGATSYLLPVLYGKRGILEVEQGLWRPITGVQQGIAGALSELSILVWLVPAIVLAVWVLVRRTSWGLRLAAVGEHPFAARSAGVDPGRMRLAALLLCGVFCALGGAALALGSIVAFRENMTEGRGYIAFTAVIFGGGGPIGAALASLFFGLADAVGIQTQLFAKDLPIPSQFVLMLPYVLTVIAVLVSGLAAGGRSRDPGAFGELRDG